MKAPSGENIASSSVPGDLVIWVGSPPSMGANQMSRLPLRSLVKTRPLPSGAQEW